MKKFKVAIYIRVSRIDLNPENQKLELVRFAKGMGWDYEIFEEVESTRKTRPIKNKVFQDALKKKYDLILIYKLDRWARSLQELINDINQLKNNKVEFRSLGENIVVNEDPRNMLMIQILGAFAEFEREIIRERTLAGLARAKAQGKKLGRPRGSSKPILRDLSRVSELLGKAYTEREISQELKTSRYRVREAIKHLNKIKQVQNTGGGFT